MPDSRVLALHYRFASATDGDRFDKATSALVTLGSFDCVLEEGVLKAVPTAEFRSREAARDALEPFLRNWEQDVFLAPWAYRIRFEYERSEVEGVNPAPGSVSVFPEGNELRVTMGIPTVIRDNYSYPLPSHDFQRTLLTDSLAERLRTLRDGQAELPATAYLVLSALEQEFGRGAPPGGRREATARALAVDVGVLDSLGRLSSRDDPQIGRKGGGASPPLTGLEQSWMHAVIFRLARRAGEWAAGVTLPRITLADFPSL